MVGAQSPDEDGLFYQWGDIIGHNLEEGYVFSIENYEAKGLNLITSDLDEAHDAARAFYGPIAKMPSNTQLSELIDNCDITIRRNRLITITSRINGASITIRPHGFIAGQEIRSETELRAWSTAFESSTYAASLHVDTTGYGFLGRSSRTTGCNIMAVHS